MGNFISCCFVEAGAPTTAKLLDLQGNLIRHVNLPLTAAELMLEEPGHMVSSGDDIQRTKRLPAMKADEDLSPRKIYVLVPSTRVQSKLSVSEMGLIMSASKKKRSSPKRRRSSKVLPTTVVMSVPDEGMEAPAGILTRVDDTGPCCGRRLRPWTPSLETVSEED